MKLSIVIPCYNEAKNIPLILNRYSEIIQRNDIEVILVNNGSTDDSENLLNKIIPDYTFARVINVKINIGYGHGIYQGLISAKGEFIGWTHADMQTDPIDTIKALDIIEGSNHERLLYVKGRRVGRPFGDQIFTLGMSVFESLIFFRRLYDINAQPNIFHSSFLKLWNNPPLDFSLDLYSYCVAKSANYKFNRFPVKFGDRLHGHSKWNTGFKSKMKFIKRTLLFSFSIRNRLNNDLYCSSDK